MFWLILALAAVLRILFSRNKTATFRRRNQRLVRRSNGQGKGSIDTTLPTITAHFISTSYFYRRRYLAGIFMPFGSPVVLASLGAVWLALKYDRIIPRPVARTAALAMAVSPGFIFYGRYSFMRPGYFSFP